VRSGGIDFLAATRADDERFAIDPDWSRLLDRMNAH
jgi:hypothetical protein